VRLDVLPDPVLRLGIRANCALRLARERRGGAARQEAFVELLRTAAIEARRSHPEAICVALHPGTVDTGLSEPFARTGLSVQSPEEAAARLLSVLAALEPADTGSFFDYSGERLPW